MNWTSEGMNVWFIYKGVSVEGVIVKVNDKSFKIKSSKTIQLGQDKLCNGEHKLFMLKSCSKIKLRMPTVSK